MCMLCDHFRSCARVAAGLLSGVCKHTNVVVDALKVMQISWLLHTLLASDLLTPACPCGKVWLIPRIAVSQGDGKTQCQDIAWTASLCLVSSWAEGLEMTAFVNTYTSWANKNNFHRCPSGLSKFVLWTTKGMNQQVHVLSHFQLSTSLMCIQCCWEMLCRLSAVCGEAIQSCLCPETFLRCPLWLSWWFWSRALDNSG
jgi:hypothetical protein